MRESKKREGTWGDWRWQMQHAVRSVDELVTRGIVDAATAELLRPVVDRYPLCITPYYLALAQSANRDDPILRQCLPDPRELEESFVPDPFAEAGSSPVTGLVQRYPDRVLVVTTSRCAVSCRHCTRKNVLHEGRHLAGREHWETICLAVQQMRGVREVILSGGDPLLLETDTLDWMLSDLREIAHVEVVRIGTRVPVALPMRIDDALADVLARHRPLWINTQFNHPVEVTPDAVAACERLLVRGIPVSNQSVLLRGVNDNVDTMRLLCNSLQRNMIRPYYVFQCDPVRGTGHFHTEVEKGLALSRALRRCLGGLAMPTFVADTPGSCGKTPLADLANEEV